MIVFLNVQPKHPKLHLVVIDPCFTFCHYKNSFVSSVFVTALSVAADC